ncbi:flagellar hook-length control protein FliK [Butyrivibrio sp. INlla14]|uniref:flagellar hook-length control protein FliK n=1 Tax=Butyrivibrio sp. INlla14 TaxID=1520808 RepID=UPI000876CE57|nr:flagellar hook-length control protein FliK [Butyrivibrio sp. INlla14]SCX81093.1 Flagellar hook-length control protein FliK [Butyrivibrio sp. INlla14]
MSNISGVSSSGNNILVTEGQVSDLQSKAVSVELKNGAMLSGKVLSVTDFEGEKIASIDIGNATISAKLSEGMGLKEGQTLMFAVRGASADSVSITPLFENTSIYQSTLRALEAAGLEVNNESLQMVKDMMEAGLPIDKSSLLEMSKNLNTFSDTSIQTLVEMKSLNIPINENNIEQYTSYKNYEHQVTNEMSSIIDELPKAFDSLMESGNTSAAVNLYGNVLKLFGGELSSEGFQNTENTTSLSPEKAVEGSAENEEGSSLGLLGDKEITAISRQSAADRALALLQGQSDTPKENGEKGLNGQLRLSNDFLDNLQNLNISEKTLQSLAKDLALGNTDASKTLFKELANAFESADLSNPVELASFKKLFSSEEFKGLLKENITDQWLLRPGDVEKKENIDNLYQRLGAQAKGLLDTISDTLGPQSKLAQSANNLSNNLDFMNQLNQMFQYVQLPLQMAGQNANGDLYVYRNKNKKMSEDGSVSAILHLDMDNLGPIDVYVKMKDMKVTTNFYVADDSVLDLINDNIHILNDRLEKRGYSLNVNLMLHGDESGENDAVDELLSVSRTPLLTTNSFDARA